MACQPSACHNGTHRLLRSGRARPIDSSWQAFHSPQRQLLHHSQSSFFLTSRSSSGPKDECWTGRGYWRCKGALGWTCWGMCCATWLSGGPLAVLKWHTRTHTHTHTHVTTSFDAVTFSFRHSHSGVCVEQSRLYVGVQCVRTHLCYGFCVW